jgi:hypothetical protein
LQHFANTTENACSLEDIIIHEQLVLKYLQWDIDLPNFSTCINNFTVKWDYFIENINNYTDNISIDLNFLKNFKFREQNPISFNLFRTLTQLIDIIIFDVEYLQLHEKYLTISIIFLIFFRFYGRINFSEIPFLENNHIQENEDIIFIFNKFLKNFCNIEYINIIDHIKYVSCYMDSILFFDDLVTRDNEVIRFYFLFIFLDKNF